MCQVKLRKCVGILIYHSVSTLLYCKFSDYILDVTVFHALEVLFGRREKKKMNRFERIENVNNKYVIIIIF